MVKAKISPGRLQAHLKVHILRGMFASDSF